MTTSGCEKSLAGAVFIRGAVVQQFVAKDVRDGVPLILIETNVEVGHGGITRDAVVRLITAGHIFRARYLAIVLRDDVFVEADGLPAGVWMRLVADKTRLKPFKASWGVMMQGEGQSG